MLSYRREVAAWLVVYRRTSPVYAERIALRLATRAGLGRRRDGAFERVWRLLDLLERDARGDLHPAAAQEVRGMTAELQPLVARIIAGQDRWGGPGPNR
jgi:hypothetical protein